MNSIITYLLIQNQYLLQIISYLCNFICKFKPLKQFIFDDSNSPDYQKFKTDKLPVIKKFEKHDFRFLLAYYQWKYLWLIMDAISRSIIGYRVSDNRGVGACIMAMRMAFKNITELPKTFRFIADGYPAYPLAAQQFALNEENPLEFDITQVIGLTNDDAVSKEFRPFKQMIERLNRTFKASYRCTCGYDNFDGSDYAAALWVCYYNFLRPHQFNKYQVLNKVEILDGADTMQGKWQLIIFLGQQTILNMQSKLKDT